MWINIARLKFLTNSILKSFGKRCTWEDALSEASSKDDAVILLIHVLAAFGIWKAHEQFIIASLYPLGSGRIMHSWVQKLGEIGTSDKNMDPYDSTIWSQEEIPVPWRRDPDPSIWWIPVPRNSAVHALKHQWVAWPRNLSSLLKSWSCALASGFVSTKEQDNRQC